MQKWETPWSALTPEDHLRDGEVVGEWGAATKLGYRLFNGDQTEVATVFQSLGPEEFPTGVFSLGNAIGHQQQAVVVAQAVARCLKLCPRNQPDGQVTLLQLSDLTSRDQQWRHMSAVHQLQFAIIR